MKAAYCNAAQSYGVKVPTSCAFYEAMSSARQVALVFGVLFGLTAILSLLIIMSRGANRPPRASRSRSRGDGVHI